MDLISVIVPVYGVENYLRECVDSILAQTYSNLEIILVDDGSPDASGLICDEYVLRDARVRCYHKKNGGLSSARNYGLERANGDYLCFIDSDDWIADNYLEALYEGMASSGADIGFCDISAAKSGTFMRERKEGRLERNEILFWLQRMISREYVLAVIACNKLYKKSLWKGVRFPLGKLHEDEFVAYQILSKAGSVYFTGQVLYMYREREDSITSDKNRLDVRHMDVLEAYEQRMEAMEANRDYQFLEFTCKNALLKTAAFYQMFQGETQAKEIARRYRQIYQRYGKYMDMKKRMKYLLFFFTPRLFYRIYIKG